MEIKMTKTSLEKMIVQETKDLSVDALNEILDFIEFIKVKKSKDSGEKSYKKNINTKLSELSKMSLMHLEEEFANYKEMYPHE